MAVRKTINFLPGIFRTDTNKKFLSATVDQLTSEPNLKNIYGYIGRKFAPTYKADDSYIIEDTADRQKYQLEPSIVVENDQQEVVFFASYMDLLNKIKYYGGIIDNHSRLFDNEYYSFEPHISLDKFVNFSQYYWLENGPDAVAVNTSGVELVDTYTVTRNIATGRYEFISGNRRFTEPVLARGGTYKFVVDQPGVPFWIQSELGIDGLVNATPTISTREVLGVSNNGADSGEILFNVPPQDAQSRFVNMQTVYAVDYASPLVYADLHNKFLSQFLSKYPRYAGITGSLNGKTLIFVDTALRVNSGEEAWTASVVVTPDNNELSGYGEGEIVDDFYRYAVWKVVFLDLGFDDPLVRLTPIEQTVSNCTGVNVDNIGVVTTTANFNLPGVYVGAYVSGTGIPEGTSVVSVDSETRITLSNALTQSFQGPIKFYGMTPDQKVFIRYGIENANREFYKDYDGFFKRMPLLTSLQEELYFQDGASAGIYGTFRIVDPVDWTINVDNDILGKKNYTSPNGIEFTSGLKVRFDQDVRPTYYQEKEFYVEGVGDDIRLVDTELLIRPEAYNTELELNYPDQVFPEYVTINRGSKDLNPWSRNNRWFHKDVITKTAEYNKTVVVYDQALRAQRPIIQFESDLQLINNGRIGKRHIDILDTTVTNAFKEIEGKSFSPNVNGEVQPFALGLAVTNGMRVIFAADQDPLVRDKIYVINLVKYQVDINGAPTGNTYIKLTLAEDGDNQVYDTLVVAQGRYKGSQWWYDGAEWKQSQQKTHTFQEPLFDVFDKNGTSFSQYVRSDFVGTRIFGYKRNSAGTNDHVLGFPLSYRNFGTQGDIEFQNYFDTDFITYDDNQTVVTEKASKGFLHKIVDRDTVTLKNNWNKVVESSKQNQLISYFYGGSDNRFVIDVVPIESTSVPYIKVYQNNIYLQPSQWELQEGAIVINTALDTGDKIDILIYSADESKIGQFQIPLNLDLNAQNVALEDVTLGQMRNHLVELSQNSFELDGNILGGSNLRDIEIKSQGGNILQHSAPIPYSALFLLDESANFVDALRLAQQEYAKFKNKFLELSATLSGINANDPEGSVDLILSTINAIKNKTFAWYYSDMVPYGALTNIAEYTVFNPLVRSYEISSVFDDTSLSNRAVLVYHNGIQLIKDRDYTFDKDRPAVTFTNLMQLEVDDTIKFVEYLNTDGNYIPETPSKLGLYPKFVPEIFEDDTYRNPITVIKGHDGSLTPAFNDYRDQFLLELEKRIFNNIKLPQANTELLWEVLPGKFRDTDYNLKEINQLLSKNFLTWIGNNKLDFSTNDTFRSNDPFTWNYSRFLDRVDGESLPGSWRACYQYFYDTIRPHLTPWEMLGFSIKPDWWEEYYGPAPYTGGNRLLWDDLEAGRIVGGDRAGIDVRFARPGLTSIIPIDENGLLLSPAAILTASFNSNRAATAWAVGNIGPVEAAWRNSSDYPFAVQLAMALAKPAKYFGLNIDPASYNNANLIGQWVTGVDSRHVTQEDVVYNGVQDNGSVTRTAGYLNWIAESLVNRGINPYTKINTLVSRYQVKLAYKLAGYSDQKYLRVLAEQSSPTSTNDSIIIPNENYDVHLYKSTPVDRITYSSVIVEKTTNGFTVRGYDLTNPYFTVVPSVINSNGYKISVLNSEATVFNDFQPVKLTVPYGYEFKSQQQVVDFLISYERYLRAQGFVFTNQDEQLGETRNFKLSSKEFLFWAQQGWAPGSIIVLSPVAETINVSTNGAIVDTITNYQYGSKVLDQNFKLVKNNNYNVMRTPTEFKITLTNDAVIGYFEATLVQYEHVLIFDNTTVFNDIIYKPELGNRQFRLKLIGQKTAEWDGSLYAPGFIYSSGKVDEWVSGKDYFKGELVQYKQQYYVALENAIASTEFNFGLWKQIDSSEIRKGLLPNWASIAVKSQSYYDSYGMFNDADQIKYSHGLIGFKPRKYLDDLGLNETTQIELYKGFIKQKGSINAIEELTTAEFNNLKGNIDLYEEWAVRVGEYGALDINPYVEISLDEQAFSINPALVRFVDGANNNQGNGVTVFNKSQLYRSTDQFDGTIALNRDETSNYDNDILTAGYVNIDDVDATVFDLRNYKDLNNQLSKISSGFSIWVAKDFTQDWNVYRVTETNNKVVQLINALDGYINFISALPHGLVGGDIFLVKGFSEEFDGFYQVYRTGSLTSLVVEYAGDTSQLSSLDGDGMLFKLDSLRFQYMEDARQYVPPHGWKAGEKIWIDDDAATSILQGQSANTDNNTWKVYEKTIPWQLDQKLSISETEYATDSGFGTSVKLSADGLLAVTGIPFSGSGNVVVFSQNFQGDFERLTSLRVNVDDVEELGFSVDLATDLVATGAPGSYGNVGVVSIYTQSARTTNFINTQIVVPGNILTGDYNGDRFGHSVAFDESGDWLYVGAPGNDKVYIYGRVNQLSMEQQTVSINDENTLTLSDDITANAGAYITQPITGANVILVESVSGSNIIKVNSITNIVANAIGSFGNISINSVDAGVWVTDSESEATTNSFGLSFVPEIEDDPTSLTITSGDRIFVPYVDYTVNGNIVTFSSNIAQGVYLVTQAPCYHLMDTKEGPPNSGFGLAIDSSYDGAQLAVGAPYDTVDGKVQAGAVYVYDRVIEAFKAQGQQDFITTGDIKLVHRVKVNDVETQNYTIIDDNTIRFINPPEIGDLIYIETNEFKLLELLIGTVVQAGAHFGTSLTICSNNCAIYVGAPQYDNGTAYNTGAVFKFHNRGRLYGTNTGHTQNPVFTPGDTIRLDNFEVVITGTSLDDVVDDINNANILGVTAVNSNGYLQIRSDKTVAKNLLRILSGSGTTPIGTSRVLDAAGMAVFAEMQIIVNPYNNSGEYFGSRVILAANAYMLVISSERGTTKYSTTFDMHTNRLNPQATEYVEVDGVLVPNTNYYILNDSSPLRRSATVFDGMATSFIDSVPGSGSTYIYELYDDPRDDVEHPGRYAFAQQLNSKELNIGDKFGAAIDIMAGYILVGAPADDTTLQDAGSVYVFNNPQNTRGWKLIRYQQPLVDIDSVNRIFLYNNITNTILTNMEFIDPAKGKIVGLAEQEINYKTEFDPAVYNRGFRESVNLNDNIYWNDRQVDQVWWNLDQVRFLDYEQSSLDYRSINWGRLFPGSQIEICEWIESSVLPSQYDTTGTNGSPKYPDDSAYVEINYVDSITGVIGSKYYYWVVNRASISVNNTRRSLTARTIQDLIENPKSQGVAYAAIIRDDAVILYNVGNYLSSQNTILHLDYETVKNSSIIHSEYHLIQKGNPAAAIPDKIVNKLIDSLAGTDVNGAVVPDPNLSPADRYGISNRPRQSMMVDRLGAVVTLVEYVNAVLATKPVARQYDLTQLNSAEPEPLSIEQSAELGVYNERIDVETDLLYINTSNLAAGYKILVANDTSQDGLWVVYELTSSKQWEINRVQSYKTSIYWEYKDWYAAGYSSSDKATYVVNTNVDALKLPFAAGDIIKINNTGSGEWQLVLVNDQLAFETIGIQNGTLALKENISNFADNDLGFGNQSYDNVRYDQNPNIEIRSIINALKDDIFINELSAEFNKLFFVMVNYLLVEQKYIDWIFKTSFISVTHKLRDLAQYPNYIKDNQTYYQNYIEEVKPYSSKIREYLINYTGKDLYEGSVTDFDLPAYYDQDTKIFRSPSGEIQEKDQQLWATGYIDDQLINQDYPQWYANRNYSIERIDVVDQGAGYTLQPTVTIIANDSTGSGATARAVFDFDSGKVTGIILTNPGSGYSMSPTVVINGGSIRTARAYAVLKNDQVRTIGTTIKFDRVNYRSIVEDWKPHTQYYATVFDPNGYVIFGNVVAYNGTGYTIRSNMISSASFVSSEYDVYDAANIKTANDRIMAYYQPQNNMPVRDLKQLVSGIDYPGIQVTGLDFEISPEFPSVAKAALTLDQPHGALVGNVIAQSLPVDVMMTFNGPITANVGDYITQNIGTIFDPVYANITVYGSQITRYDAFGNLVLAGPETVINSHTIYATRNNDYDFDTAGNILLNGTEIEISTLGDDNNWSNVGVKPLEISIGNTSVIMVALTPFALTVTSVIDEYSVEGTINNNSDILWNSNVQVEGIWTSAQPAGFNYITSTEFNPFDSSVFDGVDYDESGTPQNSNSVFDSILQSRYTDGLLGVRAEDIDVDGGSYVDTYSSHAPEELIPGAMSDSLNLQVYTSLGEDEDSDIVAYRVFQRNSTLHDKDVISAEFMQIADDFSTKLAAPLHIGDTEIFVEDASKLGYPNPSGSIPGVVFIDGERITYYIRDVVNNKLGQIRRGTLSTPTPLVHGATRPVVDGGFDRYIRDIQITSNVYEAGNSLSSSNNLAVNVLFSSNISANIGDFISQPVFGANAMVLSNARIASNTLTVTYLSGELINAQPINVNGVLVANAVVVSTSTAGFLGNTGGITNPAAARVDSIGTTKYVDLLEDINLYEIQGAFEFVTADNLINGSGDAVVFLRDRLGGGVATSLISENLVTENRLNIVTESGAYIIEE